MSDNDSASHPTKAPPRLDDLLRRTALRSPGQPALADHAGAHAARLNALGLEPLSLTYAQADHAISALAAQLGALGLAPGSVVALQMTHCAQSMIALLAVLRAGLTAALVPMLWRRAELAEALAMANARAIIVSGFGPEDAGGHHVLEAAAEVFAIRQVLGFGEALAEGISRLPQAKADTLPAGPAPSLSAAPAQTAIISFERMIDGLRMVPRSHSQLIAGGLAVFLESGLAPGARLLSAFEPMSFVALAAGFVPWLLAGGTLVCAQAGGDPAIADDLANPDVEAIVAPAQLALVLGRERVGRLGRLQRMIALWRAPEQLAGSADWGHPRAQCVDVLGFGEAGLLAATRTAAGRPALILPGLQSAPRFRPKATAVGEAAVSTRGTLVLRGPMVVAEPYMQPVFGDMPRQNPDSVDTGYRARVDARSGGIVITAPPAGLMPIGGYRFFNTDFEFFAKRLGDDHGEVQLAALPERINGHRLLGRAADNEAVRAALESQGVNALLSEAFRARFASPAG